MSISRKDIERIPALAAAVRRQEAKTPAKPKRSKYRNRETWYNGRKYASVGESDFAKQLDWQMVAGTIKGWGRQIEYVLEGGVCYVADFVIHNLDGTVMVVDYKSAGTITQAFRNKAKQLLARHNIVVVVVGQ